MTAKKISSKARLSLALLTITTLLTSLFATSAPTALAATIPAADAFGDPSFYNVWQRTDYPVASEKLARSWYWGPKPQGIAFYEDYKESKGGQRLVQYFDKSRMEINNPATNAVTNGLIVVEMITGKLQKGDATFEDKGAGANIPIAGDLDNTWPTYASLKKAYNVTFGGGVGDVVQTTFAQNGGGQQQLAYVKDPLTKVATIENNLGIPQAFWEFLNRKGTIYQDGQYQEATVGNWLYTAGLPTTEAYWTRVRLAGKEVDVMFQAFERRVMTYTPSNPDGFRVEMGNVGSHYVTWRYDGKLPSYSSPEAAVFVGKPQPDWYMVTGDTLNVRSGPGTTFGNPPRTATLPYLTQLYKGNRIQALKSVQGEEIEKGNSTWYQFYQDPDMFVYSGYVQKMTLPDMPANPKPHAGIWVSVNLDKQMMGVYEGPRLLYKTMIASGVPNDSDPKKDFRTPKGSFKIDGSYRPKSQTMENTTSDKAAPDYYKIENIRNVNYFYQDYAIHGSYWHARYGTFPQSHGCVNATTYDAGLIFQLKAGTPVEVF